MKKEKIEEIRRRLREIDEKYETDPHRAEKEEKYRRKYSLLTQEELEKEFTI
jgi:hypothetical protein